jgi:hypothetical protein
MEPLEPTRKCFRLIGARELCRKWLASLGSSLPAFPFPRAGSVLVERTAADIKPQIDENLENVRT